MDYPAKIILFGEYGIILNSKALAIPYPRFSGRFSFSDDSISEPFTREGESNAALQKLNTYFKSNIHNFQFLNTEHFEGDIFQGLYFDSSIPSGSGLGSSGALTAALYDRYAKKIPLEDIPLVRKNLATIESCFHGVSSGIDPIISWLKKPFLLDSSHCLHTTIDLSPFFDTYTIFLINSHSSGNTGILVNDFMEKYQESDFREKIDNGYIPLINQTIDALLAADFTTFEDSMESYSQFQISYFQPMIPTNMINYFRHGTDTRDFHLKICGSGGGGYILGIARDREKAENYFNLNHLDYWIV